MKYAKFLTIASAAITLLACNKSPETTQTEPNENKATAAPLAATSKPAPPPAQEPKSTLPPEKYEQGDPEQLQIDFRAAMKSIEVDSAQNIVSVDGAVKQFTIGGHDIELTTDKITKEGNDAFLLTKQYGKFKITSNSNGGMMIWFLPSQKARLLDLLKQK